MGSAQPLSQVEVGAAAVAEEYVCGEANQMHPREAVVRQREAYAHPCLVSLRSTVGTRARRCTSGAPLRQNCYGRGWLP